VGVLNCLNLPVVCQGKTLAINDIFLGIVV